MWVAEPVTDTEEEKEEILYKSGKKLSEKARQRSCSLKTLTFIHLQGLIAIQKNATPPFTIKGQVVYCARHCAGGGAEILKYHAWLRWH